MPIALDFSDGRPDPAEMVRAGVSDVFVYCLQRARDPHFDGYLNGVRAAGIRVHWIWETTTTRAFDGYQAGLFDGPQAERYAVGGEPLWVCLGDTSNVSGFEIQIGQYARGFGESIMRPDFGGYGPLAALKAGQAASPKLTRWWGVETWIPGSTPTGQPDHVERNTELWAKHGIDVLQIVGESPVGGTDWNVILKPFGEPSEQKKEFPMACLVQTETAIALVDGWVVEGLTIEQVGEYQAKGVPGPFSRSNEWLGRIQAGPDQPDPEPARARVRAAILNAGKGTSGTRAVLAEIAAAVV